MSLVHGHPGPKCFNLMITKYIVHGTQPDAYAEEEMVAADCIMALQKVKNPNCHNAGSGLKSRSQICVGGVSHLNLANWTLDKKYQRGACLSTWQ